MDDPTFGPLTSRKFQMAQTLLDQAVTFGHHVINSASRVILENLMLSFTDAVGEPWHHGDACVLSLCMELNDADKVVGYYRSMKRAHSSVSELSIPLSCPEVFEMWRTVPCWVDKSEDKAKVVFVCLPDFGRPSGEIIGRWHDVAEPQEAK